MRKHTYFGVIEFMASGMALLVLSLFWVLLAEDTLAEDFSNLPVAFAGLLLMISFVTALTVKPPQVRNLGPPAIGLYKDHSQKVSIDQGGLADDMVAIKTIRGTYLLSSNGPYIAYPDGSVRTASIINAELLVPLELTMAQLSSTVADYEQPALQPLVGNKVIGLRRFIYCGMAAALLTLVFSFWDTWWGKYYTWQAEQAPGVSVASLQTITCTDGKDYLDLTIKKGKHSLAFEQLQLERSPLGANIQIAAVDGMYLYDSMAFINPFDEDCLNRGVSYNRQLMHKGLDIGTRGVHRFLIDRANFDPVDLTELSGNLAQIRQWLLKVPTWPNTYSYVGGYYENDYYIGYQPRPHMQVKHYLFKSATKRNGNL